MSAHDKTTNAVKLNFPHPGRSCSDIFRPALSERGSTGSIRLLPSPLFLVIPFQFLGGRRLIARDSWPLGMTPSDEWPEKVRPLIGIRPPPAEGAEPKRQLASIPTSPRVQITALTLIDTQHRRSLNFHSGGWSAVPQVICQRWAFFFFPLTTPDNLAGHGRTHGPSWRMKRPLGASAAILGEVWWNWRRHAEPISPTAPRFTSSSTARTHTRSLSPSHSEGSLMVLKSKVRGWSLSFREGVWRCIPDGGRRLSREDGTTCLFTLVIPQIDPPHTSHVGASYPRWFNAW